LGAYRRASRITHDVHAASSSLRQDRSSPPSRPALELSLFRSSGQSSVLAMFSGHNTL
ncbi:unnamed protein product, partial [Tilletia caries]